jgi:hypothetical protein
MKRTYLIVMIMLIVCLTSCQEKSNVDNQDVISESDVDNKNVISEKDIVTEDDVVAEEENTILEWNYDLTNDGKEERILVDVNSVADDTSDAVEIYSGETEEIIWSMNIDTIHSGKASVSIYMEDESYYILVWDPAMSQGSADYQYRIFSLTEEGKEVELKSNNIIFDISECEEEDINNVIEFSYEVNDIFENSFLLISTTDTIQYSTVEKVIKSCFSPEMEVGEMVMSMYRKNNFS